MNIRGIVAVVVAAFTITAALLGGTACSKLCPTGQCWVPTGTSKADGHGGQCRPCSDLATPNKEEEASPTQQKAATSFDSKSDPDPDESEGVGSGSE